MLNTRVIPCLLLRNQGLVKTTRFTDPKYVGDPLNAVRIFNEKEVDELIFLDITASPEKRDPPFKLLSEIAGECFMPLCYGGGIRTLDQIKRIFGLGVEKVALNTSAASDPEFVRAAARAFGSQSILVSIDVRKTLLGKDQVVVEAGKRVLDIDPVAYAIKMQQHGAGELLLTAVNRDGSMDGYDLQLIQRVTRAVTIPVIACGGAGKLKDFVDAVKIGGASAVAAGSMFVFHGKHRAVLISYPAASELQRALA